MPRQFPTYVLNEEGFLIRTIFPKFIAHIPKDNPVTEEMKVLQWWDDADDKKKAQTIHHAKKWFVYHDDRIETIPMKVVVKFDENGVGKVVNENEIILSKKLTK